MKANRGFTLVEILIVVVILGILAAIVVPQFTQASTEAKVSSSLSSLQSLRSQIELYRIQHNDNVPTLADFEDAMTMCSNAALSGDGYVEVEGRDKAVYPYGPYMQILPVNPWNNQRGVAAAGGANNGWIYDQDTGAMYLDATCLDDEDDAAVLASLKAGDALVPEEEEG
ncbi:MAG: prepilin-type N-terminal cleavage/methylation domain-containing protein [Phycisphaerae bacterium]|nr:prepilin-type N-terminal cleavage/methylation domain-containing protein [Phycisphaerae bacterium]